MAMHSAEEIEAMFRAMGLASESDRRRFLSMQDSMKIDSPQVFIRVDVSTRQEEDRHAELARPA